MKKTLIIIALMLGLCLTGCNLFNIQQSSTLTKNTKNNVELEQFLVSQLKYRESPKSNALLGTYSHFVTPNGEKFELDKLTDDEVYTLLVETQKVIYGKDDRLDYYQIRDPKVLANADATGGLWKSWDVMEKEDGTFDLITRRFSDSYNLHSSERFRNQPLGAFCTVFLVAPDIVVSAGHCASVRDYRAMSVVFGYNMIGRSTPRVNVPANNVYKIKEVISRELKGSIDYGVFRLDRPVETIEPMKVSRKPVKRDDNLYIIGHPVGLPLKYAPGAKVTYFSNNFFFRATLDAYGGNSGSPVFNEEHEVVGILVRGNTDFITVNGTTRSYVISEPGRYEGESVSKVSQFIEYLP